MFVYGAGVLKTVGMFEGVVGVTGVCRLAFMVDVAGETGNRNGDADVDNDVFGVNDEVCALSAARAA